MKKYINPVINFENVDFLDVITTSPQTYDPANEQSDSWLEGALQIG